MRHSFWLLGAALLSACGPAGIISGKVTVEGGNAGGIAVIVYGPQSAATVTADDGAFSVGSLPDGKYVVHATLRGADVEEMNATTTITQGKSSGEVVLAFRASSGKIGGRVVMADGSPAGDLTVSAVGPETRAVRTTSDGAFSFEGLKTGAYVVSVEARDTLEGRVAVGVTASGPTADAGELRLTPVGRLNGTVLYNMAPAPGVPVMVTGTNLSAVTDAMGKFALTNVPTGNQAVLARVGTAPFFRSSTAMVTVARGANPELSMTLTDDPPKTGTVTGVVTFHGPRTPRDIVVSAPGSGVTGTPQANGQYTLTLPVGVWDVMASAPMHPARVLGRVTVVENQAQVLPGAELSWWRPLWRSSSDISTPATVTSSANLDDTVRWSLVTFFDTSPRLALVNSVTGEFRIVFSGQSSGHRISKLGKYAGWYVGQTAFVYEIGTATLQTFTNLTNPVQPVARLEFSSDESALFLVRTGTFSLTRIKFATTNNPETFPPSGAATDIQSQSNDRWFVRDASNAIRLVTPATDAAGVFTNVNTFRVSPTAWALSNCGAACELWVLSATSIANAVRDISVSPPPSLLSFDSFGQDNRADYPCFRDTVAIPNTAFCVKASDGSHTALAGAPSSFKLNEAGDRVIWTFPSGANTVLREEQMPPQIGTMNDGSNTVGWTIGWISPTRAYAYETSGAPRTLQLFKDGTPTTDSDVGSQAVTVAGPLLHFPQSSTSQWRAYVGDGPLRMLPVATNIPGTGFSARALGTGPVTRYAAISYDSQSAYVLDENMGTVRQTPAGYAGLTANRSGATEFWDMRRFAGPRAYYLFQTNTFLEFQEPGITPASSGVGAVGVLAWLGLSEDSRTIMLGSFVP